MRPHVWRLGLRPPVESLISPVHHSRNRLYAGIGTLYDLIAAHGEDETCLDAVTFNAPDTGGTADDGGGQLPSSPFLPSITDG